MTKKLKSDGVCPDPDCGGEVVMAVRTPVVRHYNINHEGERCELVFDYGEDDTDEKEVYLCLQCDQEWEDFEELRESSM